MFEIPSSQKNFEDLRKTSTVLSTAVSYDKELEAALVKECLEFDRKEKLKQKLELTTPSNTGNADTPLRKIKCIKKSHCRQLELYTDFNKTKSLLIHNESRTQISHGSGQGGGVELIGGKIIHFQEDLKVKCKDNELVTKLQLQSDEKEYFMIRNKKWKDQFLTVLSCNTKTRITYSKEKNDNHLQKRFYSKDSGSYKTIHSAYCGDSMALDLEFNSCENGKKIWLYPTNGGDAQRFLFNDNGIIETRNGCYFDGGGSPNTQNLHVWTYHNQGEWMKWEKVAVQNPKTREIWCGKPTDEAGLYIDHTDTKVTGQIENVSDEAACDEGYYITGYVCRDTLCNSLSLICKRVKVRIAIEQVFGF